MQKNQPATGQKCVDAIQILLLYQRHTKGGAGNGDNIDR
jgi:hypothetical protein